MYTINVSRVGFVLENVAEPGTGRIEMAKIADGHAESAEIERNGDRWKVGVLLHKGSKLSFSRAWGKQAWKNFTHVDTGDGDVIVATETIWLKYEDEAGWVEWANGPKLSDIALEY